MNAKKIISLAVSVFTAISLTACQSQEEQYHIKTKDSAYYDMSYNVYDNGLLYTVSKTAGTQAYFLDYETMNGVPLCNKPNCTHSDSSCISNQCAGSFFVPVIYHDCVYWFTSDHQIVDSEDGKSQTVDIHTKCMRAKLDTGEVEIFAEIDGVYMDDQINIAVVDDTMYIIGSNEIFQNENDGTWYGFDRTGDQYLYAINLESSDVKNLGLINDSPYAKNSWGQDYSVYSEVVINGIYNGKLYMHYQYVTDSKYITDVLYDDMANDFQKVPWVYENKCLDLKTGEITISDLPYAWWIGENHYVYEGNDSFYILDENGEKTKADNIYEDDNHLFTVTNGKLWKVSINQGFDLKAKEKLSLSDKYTNKNATVMDFVNGEYIVSYYENDELKFDRVSEEDLIGG